MEHELFEQVECLNSEYVIFEEQDKLHQLQSLVERYNKAEKELSLLEEKVSQVKKELEQISREGIPSILNSAGLSEIRLASGEKLIIQDKLKASVSEANIMLAYENMIKEEVEEDPKYAKEKIDSLFKNSVVLEEPDEMTLSLLLDNEISYNRKISIHYQTLSKYCRERLSSGKTIPEGISFFTYQETKITK